ncbi:hypothetical protein Lsan_1822 [Legionella santicrucis]|uniref:Uncharacterized protein n=1 Tax=Legionella santicrucis TaxID=45074 RepID=A0A0W0YXZ2_9GAMM|nr:hypothetical protein [Legionella santicrucis]KTD61486.1 hypothetical protein Lsan_1822 [Legionella santicrucis]
MDTKESIEILPNIYLCLSYRFRAFKTEAVSTASLLEDLSKKCDRPITLVSQYSGDLKKGEQLGLDNFLNAEDFYNPIMNDRLQKKCQ